MRATLSKTFAVLAVLWAVGLMLFWAVGMVRSLLDHGFDPFDVGNIVGLILAVIFFSIEMTPALALLWISQRFDAKRTA